MGIERDVERIFRKFGTINEVFIPKDRFSGKSRGFAFVRFFDRDDAREALRDVDGSIHDGRRLTIEWSKKDDGHERRAAKGRRSRSRSPVRRRRSNSGGRRRSRSRSPQNQRDRRRSRSASRVRRQIEVSPARERRRSNQTQIQKQISKEKILILLRRSFVLHCFIRVFCYNEPTIFCIKHTRM